MPHSTNEALLITELKAGSQQAFNAIYQLYGKQLYAFGMRYCKSRESVEELVEDTFVWLWTNRSRIRQRQTLRPLLFYRMHHYLINAYRATVRSSVYEDYLYSREQQRCDTAENLEYDDFVKTFYQALERLPAQERNIIRMSKIEQMSNKEIATKLNLKEQTVKNELSSGLKGLRAIMKVSCQLAGFLFFVN